MYPSPTAIRFRSAALHPLLNDGVSVGYGYCSVPWVLCSIESVMRFFFGTETALRRLERRSRVWGFQVLCLDSFVFSAACLASSRF